ncbi:hypothetical protein BC938DRAFT_474300 [Jimgerdemannia flammicorona]|uniref:Uncharacterized protein n=1 Tax=Jimgerdemannia flammicorona TaxID=994334 RepID=A0A433QSL8_9FUNG|nr:hypothetical protein BC938DRAFT_474300 [Jimgerdemannia flammicorona]
MSRPTHRSHYGRGYAKIMMGRPEPSNLDHDMPPCVTDLRGHSSTPSYVPPDIFIHVSSSTQVRAIELTYKSNRSRHNLQETPKTMTCSLFEPFIWFYEYMRHCMESVHAHHANPRQPATPPLPPTGTGLNAKAQPSSPLPTTRQPFGEELAEPLIEHVSISTDDVFAPEDIPSPSTPRIHEFSTATVTSGFQYILKDSGYAEQVVEGKLLPLLNEDIKKNKSITPVDVGSTLAPEFSPARSKEILINSGHAECKEKDEVEGQVIADSFPLLGHDKISIKSDRSVGHMSFSPYESAVSVHGGSNRESEFATSENVDLRNDSQDPDLVTEEDTQHNSEDEVYITDDWDDRMPTSDASTTGEHYSAGSMDSCVTTLEDEENEEQECEYAASNEAARGAV